MVMIGNIAIFVLLIGLGQASSPENDRDNMAKVRNMMNQLANLEKLYRAKSLQKIDPSLRNGSDPVSQKTSVHLPPTKKRQRPPKRPSLDLKRHPRWNEYERYYALPGPPQEGLLIRHAPIPLPGSPWPMPQDMTMNTDMLRLTQNFQIRIVTQSCDVLEFTRDRVRSMIMSQFTEGSESTHKSPGSQHPAQMRALAVTVLSKCSHYPSRHSDESYYLTVEGPNSGLLANEVWGAIKGLETFSQLVYLTNQGQLVINKTKIHDFPRFPHRGFLLDTSRHFISRDVILQHLEAMAMNKMNVFHWHIVDDQSFPYQSHVFPDLSRLGAFDPETAVYTRKDIIEIIEAARMRGIRVIPEFDTPGHTLSWGYGQDDLLVPCYDKKGNPTKFFGPINPILNSTFTFLRTLFKEVLDRFPDEYIHLGGDEVPFSCWLSNPDLNAYVEQNNLVRGMVAVLERYQQRLFAIIKDLGKRRRSGSGAIVWQEVIDNDVKVPPGTVVHVWKDPPLVINKYTAMGLQVLYSSCWYLDHIKYGQDWETLYTCQTGADWSLTSIPLENESMVLGGEACMWNEYADNSDVIARMWPRGSAVAERLWSSAEVKDPDLAAERIEQQRCRMLRNGLRVGVLSGPGFCSEHKRKHPKSLAFSSAMFGFQTIADRPIPSPTFQTVVITVVIIGLLIAVVSLGALTRNRGRSLTPTRSCGIVGNRKLLLVTYMAAVWVTGTIWLLGIDNSNGNIVVM